MRIRTENMTLELSDEARTEIIISEKAVRNKYDIFIELDNDYLDIFKEKERPRIDMFIDYLDQLAQDLLDENKKLKERVEELEDELSTYAERY